MKHPSQARSLNAQAMACRVFWDVGETGYSDLPGGSGLLGLSLGGYVWRPGFCVSLIFSLFLLLVHHKVKNFLTIYSLRYGIIMFFLSRAWAKQPWNELSETWNRQPESPFLTSSCGCQSFCYCYEKAHQHHLWRMSLSMKALLQYLLIFWF